MDTLCCIVKLFVGWLPSDHKIVIAARTKSDNTAILDLIENLRFCGTVSNKFDETREPLIIYQDNQACILMIIEGEERSIHATQYAEIWKYGRGEVGILLIHRIDGIYSHEIIATTEGQNCESLDSDDDFLH